jgi:hypothetical protein
MRASVQLHASATSEQKKKSIQQTYVHPRDGVLALDREISLRSLPEMESRFPGHSLVTTLIGLSQVVLYSRSYTPRLRVRISDTIVTDYPAFQLSQLSTAARPVQWIAFESTSREILRNKLNSVDNSCFLCSVPSKIRMTKSRRMRWSSNVARIRSMLVAKPEETTKKTTI